MKRQALGKSMEQIEQSNQTSFNFLQAARARDPATSLISADKVTATGKSKTGCLKILEVLRNMTGLTSKEISCRCDLDRHAVGRRMVDLEHSGLIRRGNKKLCSVNGGEALAWWLK